MALDHELDALAAQADRVARQTIAERLKRFRRIETIRAYRRLFVDASGELTADAVRVLADIADAAELGFAEHPLATDAELRARQGRRAVALHILAQIDLSGVELRKFARKVRETPS